jgi:hypothetical protein
MKQSYLFLLLGLPLVSACAPVQADYYGSVPSARAQVYHSGVSTYNRGVYHAKPTPQIHRHPAGAAVIVTPGKRPGSNVHGHGSLLAPGPSHGHMPMPVRKSPLDEQVKSQNNLHRK